MQVCDLQHLIVEQDVPPKWFVDTAGQRLLGRNGLIRCRAPVRFIGRERRHAKWNSAQYDVVRHKCSFLEAGSRRQLLLRALGRFSARLRRALQGGSGKKTDRGRGHQSAGQMPASEPPQASQHVSQVVIFDVRCGSIQSIRGASSEVVDCRGTLAPCSADGGGSRMERVGCVISRVIQSSAGGPAQFLQ
jgi:hypothetical protein